LSGVDEGTIYPLEDYGCKTFPLNGEDLYFDERFESLGNHGAPDQYNIEMATGEQVYDTLAALPNYYSVCPNYDNKKNLNYEYLIRATTTWSLTCEETKVTRMQLSETIETLNA
jgi:hypothetical protein